MKAYTGVDAVSGAVVRTSYTAASEHDITEAHNCFREDDDVRYGDSAFIGVENRIEIQAMDEGREVRYCISKRPKSRKEKHDYPLNWERIIEAKKAARRWMVEYPYYIVKRIFGCNRAIYRGIKKNGCRMDMAFSSANLYVPVQAFAKYHIIPGGGVCLFIPDRGQIEEYLCDITTIFHQSRFLLSRVHGSQDSC